MADTAIKKERTPPPPRLSSVQPTRVGGFMLGFVERSGRATAFRYNDILMIELLRDVTRGEYLCVHLESRLAVIDGLNVRELFRVLIEREAAMLYELELTERLSSEATQSGTPVITSIRWTMKSAGLADSFE